MPIKIKFYAVCRDLTNADECQIEISGKISKDELWKKLIKLYPSLEKIAKSTAIAVNNMYISGDLDLKEGDKISLIPPVSGG